ncbi:RNA polymerase sigma factor [Aquimarina agarivorans]|uniref:RNA polymerase sigma factor n=1 Tax=Aquimarina agarivorans TaxID=980584 RepID=UPI00058F6C92|nr:sigma-70 family RNA polymerase sigma factor [Aquimarina agarivorans]
MMTEPNISICEEKIYEQLYKTYADKIFNHLFYKYGDSEKAKDVVQDSFAQLWVNCKKVSYNSVKSFLYKVANNNSINDLRHQKVVLTYQKTNTESNLDYESPHFQMEEDEFMNRLTLAINSLKEGQREVFLLSRIEKKKYKEIAEIQNITVKAVEKRMQQALINIRKKIPNI